MTQTHYSLRWHNHQTHLLTAIESLFHAEALVDVTLVCAETSVRAHKVVLSACSPFLERIFFETPCKHPVIMLNDFHGWEIQALVDFMYKGEISIGQDQLQSLMRAAENLQVRGLASEDGGERGPATIVNQTLTPSTSPNGFDANSRFSTSMMSHRAAVSPFSPIPASHQEAKLSNISGMNFPESCSSRASSPLPRRKQARPMRRSADVSGVQDLSMKPGSPYAENLTRRRSNSVKEEQGRSSPDTVGESPELDLSMNSVREYRTPPVHMQQPPMGVKPELMENNHVPMSFPPMPSMAALAMIPPNSNYFGVDIPLGLYPHTMENSRNNPFDVLSSNTTTEHQKKKKTSSMERHQEMYKAKIGRPKGQHSAPRGGPPRAWSNKDLTNALQSVWIKKMTTSQASRIFGIPYNSLLMYVRGKYGKSLKLEELRRECTAAPTESPHKDQDQPITRPPSAEENQQLQPQQPQQQFFNPFPPNFFPDFAAAFPMPVNMMHMMPQAGNRPMEALGVPPVDEGSHQDNGAEQVAGENSPVNGQNRE